MLIKQDLPTTTKNERNRKRKFNLIIKKERKKEGKEKRFE